VKGIESTLIRGHGGVFEVRVDDRLVFSKKQAGRFPEMDEVLTQIA